MPFWYIGSMILTAVLTLLTRGTATAATAFTVTALLAISVVMSSTLLVPIQQSLGHMDL